MTKLIEKEMRDALVPAFDKESDLHRYIRDLVEGEHDYGTCVYAMSMAATATFRYVAGKLGVTNFQASVADLDILRRTRTLRDGFSIINWRDALYPQYWDDEKSHFFKHVISREPEHFLKLLDAETPSISMSKNVCDHQAWLRRLCVHLLSIEKAKRERDCGPTE